MFSRDEFGYLGFAEAASALLTPPCITMTQTWYEPTLQVGIVTVIPATTLAQTWYEPIINVFVLTAYGSAFTESEFSASAFSEGGRTEDATILIPNEIAFAKTWYAPSVNPGALITIPNEIVGAQTWNIPALRVGASVFPSEVPITMEWYAPNLEFIVNMPYVAATQLWNVPDIAPGVNIAVPLITGTGQWYAPAAQVGSTIFMSSIEPVQTWNIPTLYVGAQAQIPNTLATGTWYAPVIEAGVNADIPAITATQTWNIPSVRPGVLITIPDEIALTQIWNAPAVYVGVYIQVWNSTIVSVPRGTFSTTSFSASAFGEGRLEDVPLSYSVAYDLIWLEPDIRPGVNISCPVSTLAQTWYPPEISARPRRVRTQYVSH